jgi:hypothetical protein
MQFGKVQGRSLMVLGTILLALQIYILFSSAQQSGSPTQAPATPGEIAMMVKFVPGVLGLLAWGIGGYLVLSQRNASEREIHYRASSAGHK